MSEPEPRTERRTAGSGSAREALRLMVDWITGFFRRLRGLPYPRSILQLTAGTAVAQAISMLASPVLTRLYSPADWGTYGVLLSIFSISSVVVCLRYEVSIPSANSDHEAANLLALSQGIGLVVSALVALGIYVGPLLAPTWLHGVPRSYAPLLFPLLVLNSLVLSLRFWLLRRQGFPLLSRTWVFQTGSRVGAQMLFGVAGLRWTGLYLGEITARLVALYSYLRAAWTSLVQDLRRLRLREIRDTARRFRHFALFGLPSSFIDILASNLPIPILAHLYGAEAAGSFALVQRVVAMPMTLLGGNIADAFHARLATMAAQEPARCRLLFWRTLGGLAAIGIAPAVVLALFGEGLFRLVFGAQWATAGAMARLVAPWAYIQLMVGPLSRMVFVLGGQAPKFGYDAFALASVLAVLFAAKTLGMPVLSTVRYLALANVGCYLIYFAILYGILVRWSRRQIAAKG